MTFNSDSQPNLDLQGEEVFTLDEAAAFLKTNPQTLKEMILKGELPAKLFADELRILKSELIKYLRLDLPLLAESRKFFLNWMAHLEELVAHQKQLMTDLRLSQENNQKLTGLIEELIKASQNKSNDSTQNTSSTPTPVKVGTKAAIMKHFGMFKDEDEEEQPAKTHTRRKVVGE